MLPERGKLRVSGRYMEFPKSGVNILPPILRQPWVAIGRQKVTRYVVGVDRTLVCIDKIEDLLQEITN